MEMDLYRSAALPSIKETVILAAREAIPIRIIAKIVRQPVGSVRECLKRAQAEGQLDILPDDTWNRPSGLSPALPSRKLIAYGHWDADVADAAELFGLSNNDACAFMAMVKRPGVILSKDQLIAVCTVEEPNDTKYIHIRIFNLRKRLKPHGIKIYNSHARGYYVTAEHAKKVAERINYFRQDAFAQVA